MKTTIITSLLLLAILFVKAQNGVIAGKVIDAKSNTGLPGATVIIGSTLQGSVTDIDGNYKINNLKDGVYSVKVSYIGFIALEADEIKVSANTPATLNFRLNENVNELQAADVVSQRITHTDNAVLMDIKKSEQIVSGVSSQQIARSQDRTAAEVVRRIPGITVMDNGFVMIRGLNERYNTTMLNGIIAPGLESDKKAFGLDLIPASMIDRILIYKTGAPELPGEFAGGVIKITTRNNSDEDEIAVGYTSGYRSNTTFKSFYQAPKGSSDWLGKDDGSRGLPSVFPSDLNSIESRAEIVELGKKLPNAWAAVNIKPLPDQRFSVSLIKNFRIGKIKASNITSVQYGLTFDSYKSEILSYEAYNTDAGYSDTNYFYNDVVSKENVRLAIIHNWTFFLSPKTKIEFRNFFNQQGSNQSIIRNGTSFEEQSLVKSYAYRYQQRTVYSGQLHGSHDLPGNRSKLDWIASYSYANSAEPDFRRVRAKKDLKAAAEDPYQIIIGSSASTLDAGRFYSQLLENTGTVSIDYEHTLRPVNEKLVPKLRVGIYTESKQREFNARWISYLKARYNMFENSLLYLPLNEIFSSQNINDSTGFKIEEGTNPTDKYSAYNFLTAGYVSASLPKSEKVNVSGGVRVEYNRQQLTSRTYSDREIEVDNPVLSFLPSVNASYNFTHKMLLRAAFAVSLNRPEFRELAPFSYYDFTFNNVLEGNPDLKTPVVYNYDLRWEVYPRANEIISAGLFYKEFINPIEMFYKPASGTRNFTYSNADKAMSAGVEIEVKKSFSSLYDTLSYGKRYFRNKILSRMGITFNTAVISSKVELGNKAVGQKQSRPMMGQSPYIFNAGIYYNNIESRLSVAALYNIIGSRLYAVGTYGIPDIYYLPRHSADLTVSKGLGKNLEIKAGVQDLLAQDEMYRQDSDNNGMVESGDENIMKIKKGSYYTLGFNLKF
jgi:hypothetical protein